MYGKKVLKLFLLCLLMGAKLFSQNIGINTDGSAGQTLLHTKNTNAASDNILRVQNTITARKSGLQLYNSGNGADWMIYNPASSLDLRLQVGGSADVMTLTSAGIVGINTTNPGTGFGDKFELNSGNFFVRNPAGSFFTGIVGTGATSTGLIFRKDGLRHAAFKWDGTKLYLGDGSFDCCVSDNWNSPQTTWDISTGNVGIGTSSPSRLLNLHGGGNPAYLMLSTTATGNSTTDGFELSVGGTEVWLWNYENDFMSFGTNNAERMRILANGNVGIGTTGASQIFEVQKSEAANARFSTGTSNHHMDISNVNSGGNLYWYFHLGSATTDEYIFYNSTSGSNRGIAARNWGGSFNRLSMYHNDTYGALQTSSGTPLVLQPSGSGNVVVSSGIAGGSGTPTGVMGTGANNGGVAAVQTITGTNLAGTIAITTSSGAPAASSVVTTITFNGVTFGTGSYVILTPANLVTQQLPVASKAVYVSSSTGTGFVLTSQATPLTASTSYKWYYMVVGH